MSDIRRARNDRSRSRCQTDNQRQKISDIRHLSSDIWSGKGDEDGVKQSARLDWHADVQSSDVERCAKRHL
jgi:hypothetical protein